MKIALGSDHGGFKIKQTILRYLTERGDEIIDCGCFNNDACDYSTFGIIVGEKVANGEAQLGIAVCTSGVGISIAANKVKGIRCGLAYDLKGAELARAHNDINVLALSGGRISDNEAIDMVEIFLTTPFEGGRHQRRVNIINSYDAERK